MPFMVESVGRTNVGLVREKNEDSHLVDAEIGLWLVCDGMGGHVGGQVASQTAVKVIGESLRSGAFAGFAPDPLVAAIQEANRVICRRARADSSLHNMGTTTVAIRRDGELLHICHVGDSRIYRWRHNNFEQITRDHSLINLYADNPGMAAKFGPPSSNVIVRAVGLHEEVEVDHKAITMEHGDMFLLCSDGLTDMVDEWILKELLADAVEDSLADCADAMIRAALSNGGVDNVTAVIMHTRNSDK